MDKTDTSKFFLPKRHTLIVVIFLLHFFPCVNANTYYDFNQTCINAYNDIISLNFNGGLKWIEKEKATNPDNRIVLLLENYIDFLTLAIGENESDFDALKPNRTKRIDLLHKSEINSPWHRHCLAAIYLQWSFARVKFGEYMMAGLDLNRAYRLIEENKIDYPNFIPDLLLDGVVNALIGSVPENYQWATRLAGMEGAVETGRSKLYSLLTLTKQQPQWNYLLPEAYFYLSFIEMNLQNDRTLVNNLLDSITRAEPDNPLMCYIRANLYMHSGRNDQAITMLETCKTTEGNYPLHYLEYLHGNARLNKLDKDAAKHLLNFVKRYEGKNYIKSAYQRLAWISLINGDRNGYRFYMTQVMNNGQTFVDEDKQAQNAAESKEIPNIRLLKARLLFDGGYYEEALNALSGNLNAQDLLMTTDSVELLYRKARIFHELDKIPQAKEQYQKTISMGNRLPHYFAGNAALQLGLIYESEQNYSQAQQYYDLCLKMRFTEYRTSIQQKARVGKQRITQKK